MTIWACSGRRALLRIRRARWQALVAELGRRGGGRRESGAFLLADRDGEQRTITRIVFFDDIDPSCLTGGINLNGLAYSRLWDICSAERRRVIADVHTHPTDRVTQSSIDAANPMIAQPGHVALIIPRFATHPVRAHHVGVHRYEGAGWHSWTGAEAARRLFIRRWL
jgi:proteasome lid subunit RPN8/RPN11